MLCDRFLDSSLAYQGGAGGLGVDAVRALHEVGSHGLLPDRTLLLELPDGEAARARQRARRGRRRPDRRPRARTIMRASPHAFARARRGRAASASAVIDAGGSRGRGDRRACSPRSEDLL